MTHNGVLWLCLMGYSYRDISKITGRNLKNTAELLNRSFRTLNVHTLKTFSIFQGCMDGKIYTQNNPNQKVLQNY